MNGTFPAGWGIAILALIAYFSIGTFLTGEVSLVVGVLLFVFIVWFLIYRLRYRNLGNLELVRRMYADFTGMIERLKERVAEDEAPRRASADRRRQALINRERRKASRSEEAPIEEISSAEKKYAEMIERRVREARANQDRSEGTNETEP